MEKSWAETKDNLSTFLADLDETGEYERDDIYNEIIRAHRGKKGKKDEKTIYVKFVSSSTVDFVKSLAFKKAGVFINQMRSPLVNERLFSARKLMRQLRDSEEGKNWKLHVNERCQLMCKKRGEQRYSVHKQF